MHRLWKYLIRIFAFFNKEINEVRRQPRLVLSLILGPFLILMLFGIGYRGDRPHPRLVLVVPPKVASRFDIQSLVNTISANFVMLGVRNDPAAALQMLANGQADLVEIIPDDVEQKLANGQTSQVQFRYREINPINEAWIQYLGYAQVNEINKALLLQMTVQLQQEAKTDQPQIAEARAALDSLTNNLSADDLGKRQQALRKLRSLIGVIAASPFLASQFAADSQDPAATQTELAQLGTDLDALDQAITNRTLGSEQTRIQAMRDRLARFDELLTRFAAMPATALVAPLQPNYQNESGQALGFMAYYAPSVLALILQHIAVTLGALSLVRERLLGVVQVFRVAPVSARQVLLGKYLAYTFLSVVVGAVLMLLMLALQVPFLGSPLLFGGLMLLLVLASLGIGFFISSISRSDTQAVQFSMLMLLLSIFFSGFFLPLENFWAPVRAIGYALPLTQGIIGLQDVLLRGIQPGPATWLALGAITLITFIAVNLLLHRQFRLANASAL